MEMLLALLSFVVFGLGLYFVFYRPHVKRMCKEGTEIPCKMCVWSSYFHGYICNHPTNLPNGELIYKRMMTDKLTGERVCLDDPGMWNEYQSSPRSRFINFRRECEHFE